MENYTLPEMNQRKRSVDNEEHRLILKMFNYSARIASIWWKFHSQYDNEYSSSCSLNRVKYEILTSKQKKMFDFIFFF